MRNHPDGGALRAKHPERNPDSRKPPGHGWRYPQGHHPERHGKESGDQLWVLRLLQLLLQIRVGRLQRGLTLRGQTPTKAIDELKGRIFATKPTKEHENQKRLLATDTH